MALVSDWILLSILSCYVGTLFLNCAVFAQPQPLRVQFDEPDTKLARLNSEASLTCYVYGDVNNLTNPLNSIQIVKSKGEAETVVYEKGRDPLWRYNVTTKLLLYPPSKYYILLKILSVQTTDDAQFTCKFLTQDGRVHESSVRLQVYAIPDQIVCGKRNLRNTIEVTCTMVVYPSGNCYAELADGEDSQSSAVTYDRYEDEKGVYTTTCTVKGPTSRGFRIAFQPSDPSPRNVTAFSDVISEAYSQAYVSSFEVNDKSSSVVRVDVDDDLELECKARGPASTRIYLFKVKPGEVHMRLLYRANSQISYEIDDITCDDAGDYYCMAGYDQGRSRKITVVISSCGGSTSGPSNYEYKDLSQNLTIICSTLAVGGLALIISVIICALCCIRRRRARLARTAANSGMVLAVPTAPDYGHIYSDVREMETSLQMSPPPYSTICDKEGIHDVAPPPYPGVTDKNDSHPIGQQGQEMPSPPPYTRK